MPFIYNNNPNPTEVIFDGHSVDKVFWRNEEIWPNTPAYSTTLYYWLESDGNGGYILHLNTQKVTSDYVSDPSPLSRKTYPRWVSNSSSNPQGYTPDMVSEVIIEADIYPRVLYEWFKGLTNCTTWTDINKIHTLYTTSMMGVFYDCRKMSSFDSTSWYTDNVQTDSNFAFDNLFGNCYRLYTVDVSQFKFNNSTTIKQMFFGTGLRSIYGLNYWNLSNMTDLYGLFEESTYLNEVIVPSWDFGSTCNCSWMFYGCTRITRIDLSGVTRMGNCSDMFRNCSSLQYLDLSNLNASTITNTTDMFKNCGNANTVAYCRSAEDKDILDAAVEEAGMVWRFVVKE